MQCEFAEEVKKKTGRKALDNKRKNKKLLYEPSRLATTNIGNSLVGEWAGAGVSRTHCLPELPSAINIAKVG